MGGQPTSFWKFVAVVGAVAVFWFTFLNQWSRVPNQLAAPAALTATSFFDDYDNLSYVDQSSLNNVVWDGASALIFTASAGSTGEIDPNGSFGSGLVALWHMNGNAQDSSGRGNHGSIVGNVNCAASGSGKFNQGCSFDGASYIDLGKKISNFSQPFTIAGWVNPSSTSGVREVLSGGQLAQFFQLGGELRYRTNYSDSRTNALINTGQWTHVAVSYDGSAIKLYVNGVLQLTDSRGALDGEQTTWIGAYHDAGTAAAYWWLGMLDEIAVWNRALTAADITALAQATGGGSTSGSFQSAPITTGSFSQLAANWSETAAGASAVSWSGNNGASWCPINKGQTLTSSPCLPGTGLKYKVEFSGADTLQNVNFNWVPVTAGPVCGNGVIEGTEQCDGANLNNQTCASRGFTGGTLSCTSSCTFNTSQCTATTADTTPPTVPTGLTANAISSSQINLAWTASTDPPTGGPAAGYKIFRNGAQIATASTNSFQNTGLAPATAYTYAVSAYDAAGNPSAQSASVSATTQPVSTTGATLYVDNNGGAGLQTGCSDSFTRAENSISKPFCTIQKGISAVQAGDTIYIRGGIYTDGIGISTSGTSAQPKTLSGYPGENVVVDGRSAFDVVYLNSAKWWKIQNMEVKNARQEVFSIVNSQDITIENVVGHESVSGGHVFRIDGSERTTLRNVTGYNAHNIVGVKGGCNGVSCAPVSPGANNTLIVDSTFYDAGEGGDVIVTDNTTINTTILRTRVYGTPTSFFQSLIDFSGSGKIQDSLIYLEPGADAEVGIKGWDSQKTTVGGSIEISGNLVYDAGDEDAFDITIRGSGSEGGGGGNNLVRIYNNTIVNNKIGMYIGSNSNQGYVTYVDAKNNISSFIRDQGGGGERRPIKVDGVGGNLASEKSNLWHRDPTDGGNEVIYYKGTNYSNTQVNNGTWTSATGFGQGTFSTDPLFVNMAAKDFRLQSGSPAIDRGVLISGYHCSTSGAHPGEGCKEWYGAAPDIGAFEYTGSAPPPAAVCGNGVIEGTEQCDGANLNNQTCASRGFTGGTLSCTSSCTFNTSQCTATTADTTPPTVPTGLTANAISSSQINLTWTASTDNIAVTGYKIFRNGAQIATTPTNSFQNTGLAPATAYTYAVAAYDAAGNPSAQSASVSATTQPAADITPPVISAVTVSAVSTSTATVAWTTNEPATSQVDYGFTAGYGQSTVPTTVLVTSHRQLLANLSPATLYHYRVKSKDAAVNESVSIDFTFTTQAVPVSDTTPPQTITDLRVTSTEEKAAVLVWTAPYQDQTASDSGPAVSYDLRYARSSTPAVNLEQAAEASGEPTPALPGQAETYTLVDLTPGKTYIAALRSVDSAGNRSAFSNVVSFTTASEPAVSEPPPATGGGGGGGGGGTRTITSTFSPPTQAVISGADRQAILRWQNPISSDFVRVLILRSVVPLPVITSPGNPRYLPMAQVVYDGVQPYFTDTNLVNGQLYYYTLYAYNRSGLYSAPVVLKVTPVKTGQTVFWPGLDRQSLILELRSRLLELLLKLLNLLRGLVS